ncbi:hypothetical protein AHiyo4_46380 [Arthrobacter sp. Hiyo4]|nr:hypothetical protein AHiyo4_46380 [Arthrobacter sp. Hiyo4]
MADMERSPSVEARGQSSPPPPESEPRWLSEEEQAVWIALGSVVFRLPGALDTQLQRDAGISHFEYVVMSVLSESPERTLRMSELAVMAEAMLPRLSQVVAKLEKRGWLRRAPTPPMAGTHWLPSPTMAGKRSLQPRPATSRPSAASSLTR